MTKVEAALVFAALTVASAAAFSSYELYRIRETPEPVQTITGDYHKMKAACGDSPVFIKQNEQGDFSLFCTRVRAI